MITITNNDHKKIARGLRRLLVKEFRRYKNVQNILRTRQKISAR
jgi:hypothetical protein